MTFDPLSATYSELYKKHCQLLALQGKRPKTIEAYSRAIRRIGQHFDFEITALTEEQLLDYFAALDRTHSKSTVKLDLYGLKFFFPNRNKAGEGAAHATTPLNRGGVQKAIRQVVSDCGLKKTLPYTHCVTATPRT